MRTLIVAALFAATAALGAQTQPSTQSSQPSQPAQPSTDAQSQQSPASVDMPITVTGCLTASADQNSFTLTTAPRASMPSSATTGAAGTSGTSGASGSSAAGTTGTTAAPVPTITYTLIPQGSVDLKSHVGHTIEVKGSQPPQKQSVKEETERTQTTPEKAHGAAGQPQVKTTTTTQIVARQLNVTSVRDLAGNCQVAK